MSVRPTAAILVAPGTNRDRDVVLALNLAGAESPVGFRLPMPWDLDTSSLLNWRCC